MRTERVNLIINYVESLDKMLGLPLTRIYLVKLLKTDKVQLQNWKAFHGMTDEKLIMLTKKFNEVISKFSTILELP